MPCVPPLVRPQFFPNAPRGFPSFLLHNLTRLAFSSRVPSCTQQTNRRTADMCLHIASGLNGDAAICLWAVPTWSNYQAANRLANPTGVQRPLNANTTPQPESRPPEPPGFGLSLDMRSGSSRFMSIPGQTRAHNCDQTPKPGLGPPTTGFKRYQGHDGCPSPTPPFQDSTQPLH